jgi:5-methylcytosine-specific restriction endonuclease McrA
MNDFKILSNNRLIATLKVYVQSERKITAEIIEFIREVDRRRLYLDLGYTSLFSFLTKEIRYTPAAAQRRIDSARLSYEIPELKDDLQTGALNLSQVSMLAYALRQKHKEQPKFEITVQEKRELLEKVKNQDLISTEKIFAQFLDLEIKEHEKKHYQKDESVRLELTLTKEQMAMLERVKEIRSHQAPNPSFADLVGFLADAYLQQKDPLRQPDSAPPKTRHPKDTDTADAAKDTSAPVAPVRQKPEREHISRGDRITLFKRDRCCQWRDPKTGKQCGATFQLQVDHRLSVWRGGGSEMSNLQILCSVHNTLKYQKEIEDAGKALF